MGRPIKKKFFGNLITPKQNHATGGKTGVGAEGIASIAITNTATNSGYSTTTQVTWVASAPQITGGVPASGTAVVWYAGGTGRIQSLNVVNSGTSQDSLTGNGVYGDTTSFDSFSFIASTGTITGTVRAYGYANS